MATFNISKLIYDIGGPASVADAIGVSRTAPYRWIRSGSITTRTLERILTECPWIDINSYFEGYTDGSRKKSMRRR